MGAVKSRNNRKCIFVRLTFEVPAAEIVTQKITAFFQTGYRLGCVDTKVNAHLFGIILLILRRKILPGGQPACNFSPCLSRNPAQKSAHSSSVNTP